MSAHFFNALRSFWLVYAAWFRGMTQFPTPAEIIANSFPFCAHNLTGCGIYFWVHRGAIAYVGQSQDLECRYNGPSCVSVWPESFFLIHEPDSARRKAIEAMYIHWARPPINKTYPRCFTPDISDFMASNGITLHKGTANPLVRHAIHPLNGIVEVREKPASEQDLEAVANTVGRLLANKP